MPDASNAAAFEGYPFEGRYLPLDGGRMHYLDEGEGPPVVMVHGNPTWSYYYRGLVLALRDRHRVLVPDHIGMGLSDKPDDDAYPYRLERRIEDLDRLIEHAQLEEKITLVVHDWGGMIGLGWAVRNPERIARLVISNTAAFPLPAGKQMPRELRLIRSPLGAPLVRGLNLFCKGAAKRCVTMRPLSEGARRGYLAPYDSWANRRAVLRFVQDIPLEPNEPSYGIVADVGERLGSFEQTPTLLLWGLKDFIFDPDYLAAFERHMPWAEVQRFPEAGHYLLEDAFDEVYPHIERFLASPLPVPPLPMNTGPTNIAAALPRMAAQQPDAMAMAWPDGRGGYGECTFQELDEDSGKLAAALTAYGIGRGVRAVVMVPPGRDLFALIFALFKAGAVPVMVDPGIGIQNLKTCLAEAEPAAFLGIPKAHKARVLLGWGRKTIRKKVTAGRRLFWGGTTVARLRAARVEPMAPMDMSPDDPAAILFTSGSTGIPKGAVYSHGNFLAQVEQLRTTYGIEAGEVDLPTFPLFALFDPALGMSAVIPEMDPTRPADVDPKKILSAIERYSVTNMFGSPALLHRVGGYGARHATKLPTLKRVISAGAPVQAAVIEQFTSMLPRGTQVHTPYGATEALPVSTIGSREILSDTAAKTERGKGICVGRTTSGIEARIIQISDLAVPRWADNLELPDGEIGEIVVRGAVVTARYYGRLEATTLAKIRSADGTFWHRMGDVGYRDEEGRLWFCGRKAHRVDVKGGTLYTVPCEGVFNTHPDVYRTALVGVERKGSPTPVLCVERHPGRGADKGRLTQELRLLGTSYALTAEIETFLFHDDFPVDIRHNAKIFREKLAVWAVDQLP